MRVVGTFSYMLPYHSVHGKSDYPSKSPSNRTTQRKCAPREGMYAEQQGNPSIRTCAYIAQTPVKN